MYSSVLAMFNVVNGMHMILPYKNLFCWLKWHSSILWCLCFSWRM